jgi:hypothetical protein
MADSSASKNVKNSVKAFGRNMNERMKVATAKTFGSGSKVRFKPAINLYFEQLLQSILKLIFLLSCILRLQELDIAVFKATSSRFYMPPKEKHVRSESCLSDGGCPC